MTLQILLGHVANGSNRGERYYVPLTHTVVTGMTQYGKSTTEEAMLNRLPETKPPYRALVFLTKRGEKVFQNTQTVTPFYQERFDWEYVRGLLESSMKERLKFETPWIIRICKQATAELKGKGVGAGEGLRTVRRLLGNVLASEKLRDFDRNIYTLLAAYMDKVLPVLETAKWQFTDTLNLNPGINVMDLTPWYTHDEVQMLVIRSCMEQILERENNIIVGLPEAWKMLPQGRNTPVKLYFEKFVREGATNGNYLYIDAQDLGGVDKAPLRQVDVWVMGHMLEANEVSRLLEQTLGTKIEAGVIQTLPLGHFLVAASGKVVKVYAWPYGVPEEMSVDVAMGKLSPEAVKEYIQKKQSQLPKSEENEVATYMQGFESRVDALSRRVDNLKEQFDILKDHAATDLKIANIASTPGVMKLEHSELAITLEHAGPENVKMTTKTIEGKILYCALFLSMQKGYDATAGFTKKDLDLCLQENGWGVKDTTLRVTLSLFSSAGRLIKTEKGRYRLPQYVLFDVQKKEST